MKIDRARFLLLATAMTSAACTSTSGDGDGTGGESGGDGGSGNHGGTAGAGGQAEGGSGTGGSGGAGGNPACDDESGTLADCTTLTEFCQPYCEGANAKLKPAIAEEVAACLATMTDCTYECSFSALETACADPSADGDCASAERLCPAPLPGEPSCHQILDGMNAAGRAAVMACVDLGCEFGLYSCAEGVVFGP